MPVWDRQGNAVAVTAPGDHINVSLFLNDQSDEVFEQGDVVIVDGIVMINTDNDDMVGVRLIVAHQLLVTADLTENDPPPHDSMIYYSWFSARGPVVYRLRSKKTIPPEHRLWLQIWKQTGSIATTVRVGTHLLFVFKHT